MSTTIKCNTKERGKRIWRHDIQHNDTQYNRFNWDTQHKNALGIMLSIIMLSVAFFYCYADSYYAECSYAQRHSA